MVIKAKGRLAKRADGMYFLYIPKNVAEDSAFPIPIPEGNKGIDVNIRFKGASVIVEKITPKPGAST